jgi:hypothetical protein
MNAKVTHEVTRAVYRELESYLTACIFLNTEIKELLDKSKELMVN